MKSDHIERSDAELYEMNPELQTLSELAQCKIVHDVCETYTLQLSLHKSRIFVSVILEKMQRIATSYKNICFLRNYWILQNRELEKKGYFSGYKE